MSENDPSADNQQGRLEFASWIIGFVDGEGCFSVSIFRNRTSKFGWQVMPEFVITQSERDLDVLKDIKAFFGCGNIFVNRRYDNHKRNLYRFCVRKRSDLTNVIIPFFNQYPLLTKKHLDFITFKKVVNMMNKKQHFQTKGLNKIAKLVGKNLERNQEPSETIR